MICHLCFKAKRTSHLFNLMTHRFNNANQYVRSKMRFLLINDFLRCACLYKTFQNLMVTSIRIFTSVLSFPSEKVPAPPSPNCTLESGSSTPSFQKRSTVSLRFLRLLTAFQNQRTITGSCQIPGAEKSCRSTSNNNRHMLQFLCPRQRKLIILFIN